MTFELFFVGYKIKNLQSINSILKICYNNYPHTVLSFTFNWGMMFISSTSIQLAHILKLLECSISQNPLFMLHHNNIHKSTLFSHVKSEYCILSTRVKFNNSSVTSFNNLHICETMICYNNRINVNDLKF